MLKLQFVEGSRESFWLATKKITLGKEASNDLVIDGATVADFHAEIQSHNNDHYIVALNSHPVTVNGELIERATLLKVNDTLQVGDVELRLVQPKSQAASKPVAESSPWSLQINASWAKQSHFPIQGLVTIGRDDDCDITVPVAHLSRRHANISIAGSSLLVKDLESTNGTFLNGERITEAYAKPGDKLKFDVVNFTVVGDTSSASTHTDQTIVRATHRVAPPKPQAPPAVELDSQTKPPMSSKNAPLQPKKTVSINSPAASSIEPSAKASNGSSSSSVAMYAAIGVAIALGAAVVFYLLQR